MSYYALIRGGVVIKTYRQDTPPSVNAISPPADLVEDTQGVPCEPGWTRQGVRQYTRVIAPEVLNEKTIREQLAAALATNTTDANNADAWVAANTGTLSTAVLSNQVRQLTTAAAKAARQRNKAIRILLGRLDGTD